MNRVALTELLAATIERTDGLLCGACGGRHVASVAELERADDRVCRCECCRGVVHKHLVDHIEAEHPDLIATRGGHRVVTAAAMSELMRRMRADVASLTARANAAGVDVSHLG
jgi:hypothetical protein